MAFIDRVSVTLEFQVFSYRQVESEIRARAEAFFDGDEYTAGWVDVNIDEDGLIKVSANVYIPSDENKAA